jgi:hypothetical protein
VYQKLDESFFESGSRNIPNEFLSRVLFTIIQLKYEFFIFTTAKEIFVEDSTNSDFYITKKEKLKGLQHVEIFFMELKPIIYVQIFTIKLEKSHRYKFKFDPSFKCHSTNQIIQQEINMRIDQKSFNENESVDNLKSLGEPREIQYLSTVEEVIHIFRINGLKYFNVSISNN